MSVLLRTLYLDLPHLWFAQKKDSTQHSFVRLIQSQGGETAMGTATLIVSNNSSRQNAIIEWSASVKDTQGNDHAIDMTQGTLGDSDRARPQDYPSVNVTPLALPAFSSAEAHLLFLVNERILPSPVNFDVVAKDRTKKLYRIPVSIPNTVRNTMS